MAQKSTRHLNILNATHFTTTSVAALLCSILLLFIVPATHAKHLLGGVGGGGTHAVEAVDENVANFELNLASQHHHQQQPHLHHGYAAHSTHHRRRKDTATATAAMAGGNTNVQQQCDNVKGYFESIDIKLNGIYNEKGAICGGNCCSNSTEHELRQKATAEFERLLHHHTKSLRGILESTVSVFQSHVLELVEQSENKTLHVFSQVYRRMVPLSRKLIHQLYSEIISHLKYTSNYNGIPTGGNNANNNNNGLTANSQSNLEDAIHKFFVNLFPVAYHQAVHLSKENYGELHEDYINCLKHNFDDLQPFGTIPKDIKTNLLHSVHTATIFMNALLQSADVLSETDELYGLYLTDTCKKQLLKMNYCSSCNGQLRTQVKVCYSYCMNVLRGCSAQYSGLLDSPWSNVVDALDNLVTTYIHSDNAIVTTIKQLDGKLSETIMRAMENGPELEKKVKKTCGAPKLLQTMTTDVEARPMLYTAKWATPPDAEILSFLTTIDKSKEFYSNIVNNVCEDEDIQRNDRHCWTGERVGDYTQFVMTAGTDTQRYNPEVPLENNAQSNKLNELVDKLLKIRKNIGGAVPTISRVYSDIQADMGHQEEEGSSPITDDEEYGSMQGSGDGSGDGATPAIFDAPGPTTINDNEIETRSKASTLNAGTALITLLTLVTYMLCQLSSSSS